VLSLATMIEPVPVGPAASGTPSLRHWNCIVPAPWTTTWKVAFSRQNLVVEAGCCDIDSGLPVTVRAAAVLVTPPQMFETEQS
jgi:hypothetical protein